MYENHKLCDTLKPKEVCLLVEQYQAGYFERKFHEHVPKHRLSEEALQHLQKSLVLKFENREAQTIVRSHLNDRGEGAAILQTTVARHYPEPGVLRKYCGSNTVAWADIVVSAGKFRNKNR
jgi:hypothetical protein